jgi:hypothetical protein
LLATRFTILLFQLNISLLQAVVVVVLMVAAVVEAVEVLELQLG